MFKRIKKLWNILKYFFKDEDSLFLHLLEIKAYEVLDSCYALDVGMTEEIEDLIFHIRSYYDIEESVIATKYPFYKGKSASELIRECQKGKMNLAQAEVLSDFLDEVENQRAIEREIIFDHAKNLTFGFKF